MDCRAVEDVWFLFFTFLYNLQLAVDDYGADDDDDCGADEDYRRGSLARSYPIHGGERCEFGSEFERALEMGVFRFISTILSLLIDSTIISTIHQHHSYHQHHRQHHRQHYTPSINSTIAFLSTVPSTAPSHPSSPRPQNLLENARLSLQGREEMIYPRLQDIGYLVVF